MAIFMINRKPAEEIDGSKTVVNSNDAKAGFAEESKPDGSTAGSNSGEEASEKILIKVDGAAGYVFTEALNRVLSLESTMMQMISLDEDQAETELREDGSKVRLLHITAIDGKTLALPETISVQNSIAKDKSDKYIVAVENASFSDTKTMHCYSLLKMTQTSSTRVVSSIGSAVAQVMDFIRG